MYINIIYFRNGAKGATFSFFYHRCCVIVDMVPKVSLSLLYKSIVRKNTT